MRLQWKLQTEELKKTHFKLRSHRMKSTNHYSIPALSFALSDHNKREIVARC